MEIDEINQLKIPYLDLPTAQLLEKFGEGRHIPGSGSATALSGLLAISLMQTVCKLTIKRDEAKYVGKREEFNAILNDLTENYKPKLIELFRKDIDVFDNVSKLRVERDGTVDKKEKEKLQRLEKEKLEEATLIPIEIGKTCLNLTKYAFSIFDNGFQSARGDSGVAISNLLAAISGALFVTLINLKSGRNSKWAKELREDVFIEEYYRVHKDGVRRLLSLYDGAVNETDDPNQLPLGFE